MSTFSNISEQICVALWNVIMIALTCGCTSFELMVSLGEKGFFFFSYLDSSIFYSPLLDGYKEATEDQESLNT